MKVLIAGAAGHVGGILRPALEAVHDCRYFDIRPVAGAEDRTTVGSVAAAEPLGQALAGMDAAVQLAMFHSHGREHEAVDGSYDVHVKGLERVLQAAWDGGARRVVYASTLSVYEGSRPTGGTMDESAPPDATHLYGLTKRLGDLVCQSFVARHPEMSVISLQMVMPRSPEQWAAPVGPREDRNYTTGPEDLRRAYLAALALAGHTGYDAVFICSDLERRHLDLSKAQRLLGWVPEGR